MATDYSPVVTDTEEKERLILTAEDTRLLRIAEVVSFHFHEGRAYMRLTSRNWASDDPGYKWEHEIDVVNNMTIYDGAGGQAHAHEFDNAFAMITAAQFSPAWKTIAGLVRPGDVLQFNWIANDNSQTLGEAGLVRDELELIVYRKNNRFSKLTFNVETFVGRDNTARMVRRGAYNMAYSGSGG